MPEEGSQLPDREESITSTYDNVSDSILELKDTIKNEKVIDLLSWFPTEEAHKAILAGDEAAQAELTVQALGGRIRWSELAPGILYPQPSQEIPKGEQAIHARIITGIDKALGEYNHFLVQDLFHGDISSLIPHIKTGAQVLGVHGQRLNMLGDRPPEQLTLTFPDGRKPITDLVEGVEFLLKPSHLDLHVEETTYEPETNSMSVRFS